MPVNQRIKEIRIYRRLQGKELAMLSALTPGEISHIEKNMRSPNVGTLQKIAAALEVTTSFLLEEDEDCKLALPQALAGQSLKLFLLHNQISAPDRAYLEMVRPRQSAPDTIKGWRYLLENLRLSRHESAISGSSTTEVKLS